MATTTASATPEVEVIPPAPATLRDRLAGLSLSPAGRCFTLGLVAGLIGGVALVYFIRKRF